jgi:hypothetical protein
MKPRYGELSIDQSPQLKFVRHQKISLKSNKRFCEAWLHYQICNDTTLLDLGDLDVVERERPQESGGRLDLLLADTEKDTRYEVEILLGPTDPSHIIRCIEYWDLERRKYPAYDHVAVLVAEEVTARFLNVMALFSRSIPLVAIQLNALQVGDAIVLDFVKVLDQRQLREDDTIDVGGEDVDRQWWDARKGADNMRICDRFLQFVKEKSTGYDLQYKKSQVGIFPSGSFFNVICFWPKRKFVATLIKMADPDPWVTRLEEAGIDAESRKNSRVFARLSTSEVQQHESLLRDLTHQAVAEFDA